MKPDIPAPTKRLRFPATPQQRRNSHCVNTDTWGKTTRRWSKREGEKKVTRTPHELKSRLVSKLSVRSWRHIHVSSAWANAGHTLSAPSKGTIIRRALQLYQEHWALYNVVKETAGFNGALEQVAELAAKRYKELHEVALELLTVVTHGTAPEKRKSSGCAYRVMKFCGRDVISAKRGKGNLSARLDKHRQEIKGRCREALCSVLACLCSRLQKSWLSSYDDEVPSRGYFAHSLVDPASTFCVSLRTGKPPRLGSLVVTSELPLGKALSLMDHGGPFPEGHHKHPLGDREYGLHRVGVPHGRGDDLREPLQDVKPEATLRELMGSKTNVVVLDVYCALAPKELVQRYRLGDIIREEMLAVLQSAKHRGMAVIFLLGGEEPFQLAQKVYLQPWFTAVGGLQCGYLRWREGPDKPWEAHALHHTKRLMFGLQLP